MGSIGETLRSTREAKGISLSQAEEDTKIRKRYLEALEQDDYDVIPGHVYTRGFLRNYAGYLGLDRDEIMMEFKLISAPAREDSQRTVNIEQSINKRRAANRSERKTYLITAVIAVLAIATLAVYNFVYKNSAGSLNGNDRPPAVQNQADKDQDGSSGQGTDNTKPDTGSAKPDTNKANPDAGNQGLQPGTDNVAGSAYGTQPGAVTPAGVNITLNGKDQVCWARVTVDGEVKFTGNINPGETKTFSGTGKIIITLGNAGAVEVVENGKSLGALGQIGQVVKNREFTAATAASQGVTP